MIEYCVNSAAWSGVGLIAGYLLGTFRCELARRKRDK